MAIPMNWSPRAPYWLWSFTKSGISSLHGPHHVAQKFTTTTLPRQSPIVCGRPSRSGSCKRNKASRPASPAGSGAVRHALSAYPATAAATATAPVANHSRLEITVEASARRRRDGRLLEDAVEDDREFVRRLISD